MTQRVYTYGSGIPVDDVQELEDLCDADFHTMDAEIFPTAIYRKFYIVRW